MVAEDAEEPVAEAAAGNAHEIHGPIARGAVLGTGDLAKDGHVVAIKESPANPENHQAEDGKLQGSRVTHAEERRKKERHPQGAREDSPASASLHPSVRNEPSSKTAGEGRELDKKDRADAGLALSELKLFSEDFRHPISDNPTGDGGQRKIQHEQEEVSVGEKGRPRGALGLWVDVAGAGSVGGFGRVGQGSFQQEKQGKGVRCPDQAAARKGVSPADCRRLGCVPCEAAKDLSDVNSGLVNAYGPGACFRGVAFSDECKSGRNVKGLTDSHEGTHEEQFMER